MGEVVGLAPPRELFGYAPMRGPRKGMPQVGERASEKGQCLRESMGAVRGALERNRRIVRDLVRYLARTLLSSLLMRLRF